jgi:hypothetical protein
MLQQIVKMLSSWPNALSVPAEHGVNFMSSFPEISEIVVDAVSWYFKSVVVCFIHFIF